MGAAHRHGVTKDFTPPLTRQSVIAISRPFYTYMSDMTARNMKTVINKDLSRTLTRKHQAQVLRPKENEEGYYATRRLTPRECERLQGFVDDFTAIPYRGKECAADTPRYNALGNSMAVPVIRHLGERLVSA